MSYNHPFVTDFSTILNKSFWDSFGSALNAGFNERLPFTGGQMLGVINWASGQTYSESGVLIHDPGYLHTGIYATLYDHIADAAVHKHKNTLVWLQGISGTSQDGNVYVTGTITADTISGNYLYGDGRYITGLPTKASNPPINVKGYRSTGISDRWAPEDHIHKGVEAIVAGAGISLNSGYVDGDNYYGKVVVTASNAGVGASGISGTPSGAALMYIDTSGYLNYIDGPTASGQLLYYDGYTFSWQTPRSVSPVLETFIPTPSVANGVNGVFYIPNDVTLLEVVVARQTAGTGGSFDFQLHDITNHVILGSYSMPFDQPNGIFTSNTFTVGEISAGTVVRIDVTGIEAGAPGDYRITLYGI